MNTFVDTHILLTRLKLNLQEADRKGDTEEIKILKRDIVTWTQILAKKTEKTQENIIITLGNKRE